MKKDTTKQPAPHLPGKSCSIPLRHKIQLIPWVIFIVFIAAITAVAVALSVVAWFQPTHISSDGMVVVSGGAQDIQSLQPDRFFQLRINEHVLTVINNTKITEDNIVPLHSVVGSAVVLTSDGWTVASFGDAVRAQTASTSLLAVDRQGNQYVPEQVLTDPATGLMYIKWNGNGFRVVNFPDWEEYNLDHNSVWAVDHENWDRISIRAVETQTQYGISYVYEADRSDISPHPLFSLNGNFVGFIDKQGEIQPAWYVESQLSHVLGDNTLVQYDLPVQGYLIYGLERQQIFARTPGFYVINSSVDALQVGDIITHIQGDAVEPKRFVEQIVRAPMDVRLTILRDGKEQEVTISRTTH